MMEPQSPGPLTTGDNVLLVAHSQYRAIYIGMARLLKERQKANVHLCVATKQEADYYGSRHRDVFATITIAHTLYDACRDPVQSQDAVLATASQNERRLSTTYNTLAVSDRHLGRGYALGGLKHPRSQISENTSYPQMVNAFNQAIAFWQSLIDMIAPKLVLGAGKVLCVLCRQHGIPIRIIASSRYRSYYHWAQNEFREFPPITAAFDAAVPDPTLTLEQPYAAHMANRSRMKHDLSFLRTARQIGMLTMRQYFWRLKRYDKARGYSLVDEIAMVWRRHRDIRRLDTLPCSSLDEIAAAGPFVFFPLATEPEATLQTISPEYFFQLEAIATLSRDLPVGVTLAVKEHYAAMGRRPTDFYRQILEFKNVRMIRVSEFGLDAVARCAAVATISGTAGFEGAALGKPVIAFGRHNIYNIVPHVHVVREGDSLIDLLASIFDGSFDADRARNNGQRFLRAIVESSFDMEDFAPARPDHLQPTALEGAFAGLLASLNGEQQRAPSVRANSDPAHAL